MSRLLAPKRQLLETGPHEKAPWDDAKMRCMPKTQRNAEDASIPGKASGEVGIVGGGRSHHRREVVVVISRRRPLRH